MPIKIGDLVTVKNNKVGIIQCENSYNTFPVLEEPIVLNIRKGIVFEVLEVNLEVNSAIVFPIDFGISQEYVLVVELDNLLKCGRAVEYLYVKQDNKVKNGKKKD